jgi:hypothetical protein
MHLCIIDPFIFLDYFHSHFHVPTGACRRSREWISDARRIQRPHESRSLAAAAWHKVTKEFSPSKEEIMNGSQTHDL